MYSVSSKVRQMGFHRRFIQEILAFLPTVIFAVICAIIISDGESGRWGREGKKKRRNSVILLREKKKKGMLSRRQVRSGMQAGAPSGSVNGYNVNTDSGLTCSGS
jgi:hypothetical protein